MSGKRQRGGQWLVVAATVAICAAGGLILVGSAPAGAAVSTVGGACGFSLGAPLVTGAAGTAGLEFPVLPCQPLPGVPGDGDGSGLDHSGLGRGLHQRDP
jgi:hypothetical protein